MKKLWVWECRRMAKNGQFLFIAIVIGALIGVGIMSGKASNVNERLVQIYQNVGQLGYLFIGSLYIGAFTIDYKNGIYHYLKQIGYSPSRCMLNKTVCLILYTIIILDLSLVIYGFCSRSLYEPLFGIVLFTLDLGIIYIGLLALLLSAIFQRMLLAIVVNFALWVGFSFMNLFWHGLTNPLDTNSLATFTIRNLANIQLPHQTLDDLHLSIESMKWIYLSVPTLVWCCVLNIGIYVVFKIRRMD